MKLIGSAPGRRTARRNPPRRRLHKRLKNDRVRPKLLVSRKSKGYVIYRSWRIVNQPGTMRRIVTKPGQASYEVAGAKAAMQLIDQLVDRTGGRAREPHIQLAALARRSSNPRRKPAKRAARARARRPNPHPYRYLISVGKTHLARFLTKQHAVQYGLALANKMGRQVALTVS